MDKFKEIAKNCHSRLKECCLAKSDMGNRRKCEEETCPQIQWEKIWRTNITYFEGDELKFEDEGEKA